MVDKIRLGIVGFGNMGTTHAKNLASGIVKHMTLGAVCDIDEERRKVCRELYPDTPVYDNAEDMYKSGSVDAVIVAIPHYDHPKYVIKALDCGLHVITEKPAGVYTKQVIEMNEHAKKSDKKFGIMYNQRTNPVFKKVKSLIENGELGNIKRINWTVTNWYRPQAYHDSASWRSTWATEGGGTLINQNPHQLDLWQWMFGMPSRIRSFVSYGKYYDIECEDDVTAFMEYDNGVTGTYITSTGEAPGTNRLEIACDMGQLVVNDGKEITFFRNEMSEREFNKINKMPFGTPEKWECKIPVKEESLTQHSAILENFALSVLEGKELLAPGEEGINGLTISNAIHYSSWIDDWADVKNFPHDKFYEMLSEKIKTSKKKTNVVKNVANTDGSY